MDKKKTPILILVIAVAVIGIGIGGYFLFKDTFDTYLDKITTNSETEESASEMEATEEEEEDTEDTSSSDVDSSWFSDIPSDVPEFTYGSAQSTSTGESSSTKIWTIIYGDVDKDDFDNYIDDLRDSGYTDISSYTSDGNSIVMVNKQPYTITVTYSSEDETVGLSIAEGLE